MFDFLRHLFGRRRPCAPPRQDGSEEVLQPADDPQLRQILYRIDQKWTDVLQQERAAESLLAPRERIKKRLNLPIELPADYRADESVPVLSPVRKGDAPTIVVVNNVGIGVRMPRVLFEYLYRQRPLTPDEERVVNDSLKQWGLGPESL